MTTCIDCGNEHPIVDRSRCYTCGFIAEEDKAINDARNAEWFREEPESDEVPC
jgi:ribosomal protein L37E